MANLTPPLSRWQCVVTGFSSMFLLLYEAVIDRLCLKSKPTRCSCVHSWFGASGRICIPAHVWQEEPHGSPGDLKSCCAFHTLEIGFSGKTPCDLINVPPPRPLASLLMDAILRLRAERNILFISMITWITVVLGEHVLSSSQTLTFCSVL